MRGNSNPDGFAARALTPVPSPSLPPADRERGTPAGDFAVGCALRMCWAVERNTCAQRTLLRPRVPYPWYSSRQEFRLPIT
jgi:hypothetical protein